MRKSLFAILLAMVLSISLITSGCGSSSSNSNTPTQASPTIAKINLPHFDKTEFISDDFLILNWISNDTILGEGAPLSPDPHGPSLSYPDCPVQYYNITNKSTTNVDGLVMYRFDYMDSLISPDNKYKLCFKTKGSNINIYNTETKKLTPIKDVFTFDNYTWINNTEFIFMPRQSSDKAGSVYKGNIDGTYTKIGTVDKSYNLLFALGNNLYFSGSTFNTDKPDAKIAYFTSDLNTQKVAKVAEIQGKIFLAGNEIILQKFMCFGEEDTEYSYVHLDKDLKEKETLLENMFYCGEFSDSNPTNASIFDINGQIMLYSTIRGENGDQSTISLMDISSKYSIDLCTVFTGSKRFIDYASFSPDRTKISVHSKGSNTNTIIYLK